MSRYIWFDLFIDKINPMALGLSSCFILLGTALLYANSGTTNLDSLYIITSISNVSKENLTGLLYWYKSYYIHISLLFIAVGFLFKVSAAPFHFWSPDGWCGKSSITPSSCLRDKLPNSGNPLEIQVPSYSIKTIGGWTNHSCKVTTLEASEKNMGNRGSKSVTVLSLNPLLIFAHYNFISFIFSFPVLHSKVSLFSSTSALLVHVKHSRTALLCGKQNLYKSSTTKPHINGWFRGYSTNSSSIAPSFQPVTIYRNADIDKVLVLKENKGKSGVYSWTNLINGKRYVGSSINLEIRLKG